MIIIIIHHRDDRVPLRGTRIRHPSKAPFRNPQVDTLSEPVFSRFARPAVEQNRSFFSMMNLMDVHQFLTAMQRPPPVFLTDPATGMPPADLPFGAMGYSTAAALLFNVSGTIKPQVANQVDLDQVDITGYRGAFPEQT